MRGVIIMSEEREDVASERERQRVRETTGVRVTRQYERGRVRESSSVRDKQSE